MRGRQTSLFPEARQRPVDNYANRGLSLERALERQHEEYRAQGKALITRQYDPSVVVDFPLARIIGRAAVDYVGVLSDGRCVAFDAKDCAGKRLELSRLQPHQAAYLAGVQCMGGLAGILARFERARVYWCPMSFGRLRGACARPERISRGASRLPKRTWARSSGWTGTTGWGWYDDEQ